MSWTDDRIDLLKKRWSEGLSASQIATELGSVTRNAVIGKVHRLKLESRIKIVPAAEAVSIETVRAPVAEAAPVAETAPRLVVSASAPVSAPVPAQIPAQAPVIRQPSARAVGATALKFEEEVDLVAQPVVETKRQSAEIVPMSRNLTLIQLSERTCKWPLGDPLSPDFRFCGNHSGDASPYCQHHARIAFQPVADRRRAR